MPKLTSMELTAEEREKECGPCSPSDGDDGPRYPYGTRLHLGMVELEKLGLTKLPVGTEMTMIAKVKVIGYNENESIVDGKVETRRGAEIQITDMGLGGDAGPPAADVLYGKE